MYHFQRGVCESISVSFQQHSTPAELVEAPLGIPGTLTLICVSSKSIRPFWAMMKGCKRDSALWQFWITLFLHFCGF